MKTRPYLLVLFFFSTIIYSCQNGDSNTETSKQTVEDNSTNTSQEIDFEFETSPSVPLSEQDILSILASKYPNSSSDDCSCSSELCFKQKVMHTHFFTEKNKTQALVLMGNYCNIDPAHAQSGWCDVALLQLANESWVMTDFWKEVGGGGSWGDVGSFEKVHQFGEKAIGFEVGGGFSGFGESYEQVDIIGYLEGKVSLITQIQTHFDNFGVDVIEENDVCKCSDFTFEDQNNDSSYALKITIKDCLKQDGACEGEVLTSQSVQMQDGKYNIPTEISLW